MKKITLMILITIFIINCKEKNTTDQSTDSPAARKAVVQIDDYHPIKYDSVLLLISDLLKVQNLYSKVINYALGGYIPGPLDTNSKIMTFLDLPPNEPAFKFYSCYDASLPNPVFSAYKYEYNYNVGSRLQCDIRNADSLTVSNSEFKYDKDLGKEKADVNTFLMSMPKVFDSKKVRMIGNKTKEFSYRFLIEYANDDGLGNEDNCGGMFAREINNLFNQEYEAGKKPIGMRYFFGYESSRICNKIRVLFLPVKQDGSIMFKDKNGNDALMIEKNWPPDCN